MSKLSDAISVIHYLDARAAVKNPINDLHPLAKLLTTFCYVLTVVSFDKYDIAGLAGMILYLPILATLAEVPVRKSLRQLRLILCLVAVVGLANPFFDRQTVGRIGTFIVTGGMVSMITLIMKGIFTAFASYLLIATTSMEKIGYALRVLHFPKGFITVILLIYRYLIVLLKEADRMIQAYQLRAPGQKGIHRKAWGSFAGRLLLRSMDFAEVVYESMLLRGYDGEFRGGRFNGRPGKSALYAAIWLSVFVLLRIFPVFKMAGSLFL